MQSVEKSIVEARWTATGQIARQVTYPRDPRRLLGLGGGRHDTKRSQRK